MKPHIIFNSLSQTVKSLLKPYKMRAKGKKYIKTSYKNVTPA